MEPILNALRIPFRFVARLDDIKPAIRKAYYIITPIQATGRSPWCSPANA
jgi:hypothetical protein